MQRALEYFAVNVILLLIFQPSYDIMQCMVYCKTYLLKNIATIQSGYALRSKAPETPNGTMSLLQTKDLGSAGIDCQNLLTMNPLNKRNPYFLKKGDVIFLGKGTHIKAHAITATPENVAAGPQFFVLTLIHGILPEYLAWYINSVHGQKYFWTFAGSSILVNVTREVLENCPVYLPSLRDQASISSLDLATRTEKQLALELYMKRQTMIEKIILQRMGN